MKKQFEPSFNIIRAVSAAAIVYVHYSYTFFEYGIRGGNPGLMSFANGDYGGIFVAMFFMLSGAAILYNNPRLSDPENPGISGTLKKALRFYIKRWLALFPMFYIAWTIMYIINSKRMGGWFWGGPRKNFLLSFLGIDGYFLHHGFNYYCLGEWFLGGIIILYLLYPLLLFLWNRARIAGTVLFTFFFLFNLRRHYFSSAPDTNIFIILIKYYNSHIIISDNMCLWTCIIQFWCGFILVTYVLPFIKERIYPDKKKSLISALFLLMILVFMAAVKLPLYKLEACTIMAFLNYILLTLLTPFISSVKSLDCLLNLISKYSYGVFLVHHVILYGVMYLLKDFSFNAASAVICFIPVFTLIFFAGVLLTKVTDLLVSGISTFLRKMRRKETAADR